MHAHLIRSAAPRIVAAALLAAALLPAAARAESPPPQTPPPPAAAAAVPAGPSASATRSCDVARGERVFASCAICHARKADVPSPAGPNLHGVVGRKAASAPGFRYSRALRESGKVWSREELDRFLAAPQAVVPGTAMAFAGVRSPADRAAVVCLLAGD